MGCRTEVRGVLQRKMVDSCVGLQLSGGGGETFFYCLKI